MKNSLSDALETCLQAMGKGRSIEDSLQGINRFAVELQPLLVVAQAAQSRGKIPCEPKFLSKNRLLLLARAAEMRQERTSWWSAPISRKALITCTIALLLALGGVGLETASALSLPGDILYGVKRGVEEIQFLLVSDPGKRAAIEQELNARRIEEVDTLLRQSRIEKVEFQGILETQTGDGWVISGIPVVITNQTEVEGILIPGDLVDVWGSTQPDGYVLAERIRVAPGNDPAGGIESLGTDPGGEDDIITPTPILIEDDLDGLTDDGMDDTMDEGEDGSETESADETEESEMVTDDDSTDEKDDDDLESDPDEEADLDDGEEVGEFD